MFQTNHTIKKDLSRKNGRLFLPSVYSKFINDRVCIIGNKIYPFETFIKLKANKQFTKEELKIKYFRKVIVHNEQYNQKYIRNIGSDLIGYKEYFTLIGCGDYFVCNIS